MAIPLQQKERNRNSIGKIRNPISQTRNMLNANLYLMRKFIRPDNHSSATQGANQAMCA